MHMHLPSSIAAYQRNETDTMFWVLASRGLVPDEAETLQVDHEDLI